MVVVLQPEIQKAFSTTEAVNKALASMQGKRLAVPPMKQREFVLMV